MSDINTVSLYEDEISEDQEPFITWNTSKSFSFKDLSECQTQKTLQPLNLENLIYYPRTLNGQASSVQSTEVIQQKEKILNIYNPTELS